MPIHSSNSQNTVRNETILIVVCAVFGLFLLPVAIYLVGHLIFGEFGGGTLGDFYGAVQGEIWSFDPVVWFLVAAPYLVLQSLRGTFRIYRMMQDD